MKNLLIALLKRSWPYLIIGAALLLFFFSGKINSCKNERVKQTVQTVTTNTIVQHVIDSIVSKAIADTISKLDAQIEARDVIIKERGDVIKKRDTKISRLTNDYNLALDAYRNDTTHTGPCDSLASVSEKTINEQKIQNDSLKSQVVDWKFQAIDYKQQASSLEYLVGQKDKTIAANNQSIDILTKVAKRTWLERNEKYFALVLGFLGGAVTIK